MATGSIAENFHQGTRSEYLAQYIFSAFGTSIPVPHPEDSGIDLKCTLGKRKGQRFWVENYYYVQVKSDETPIKYEGSESVKWFLSLKLPFLICLVNKSTLEIEVFQTLGGLNQFSNENLKELTFTFNQSRKSLDRHFHLAKMFPNINQEVEAIEIDLGKPILCFPLEEISDRDKVTGFRESLASWLDLLQENINSIAMGFDLLRLPGKYETNSPLTLKPNEGFFRKDPSPVSSSIERKYKDSLYKFLSLVLVDVGRENDPDKFDKVRKAIGEIVTATPQEIETGKGASYLIYRENSIAKSLGLEPYFGSKLV